MNKEQSDINRNVQERLRALEAQQQIFLAMMVAIIETHPRPDALRERLSFHAETLRAHWLGQALPDDWIDAGAALHKVLDAAFDQPKR